MTNSVIAVLNVYVCNLIILDNVIKNLNSL